MVDLGIFTVLYLLETIGLDVLAYWFEAISLDVSAYWFVDITQYLPVIQQFQNSCSKLAILFTLIFFLC